MKTIRIKNYLLLSSREFIKGIWEEVTGLVDWLISQNMHGKQSRMRTRFVKQLMEGVNEINKERIKMLEELADKNEKGEVLYNGKDGKDTTDINKSTSYKMTLENSEKFEKEYAILANEDYIIDLVPSDKEMVETIKNILLNTPAEFKSKNAIYYNEWCASFENPVEEKEEVKKEEIKKEKDISKLPPVAIYEISSIQPPNPNPSKAEIKK